MDYYSQGNVPPSVGKNPSPGVTVDKACKLLRSAQPLVWAIAIVFGIVGVSLTVRYLWRRNRVQDEVRPVSDGNIWTLT
jgi:hypothetical protein